VRTVRVTVLLDERESATLTRACGGRGVATLLREAGLREAEAKPPKKRAVVGNPPRRPADAIDFLGFAVPSQGDGTVHADIGDGCSLHVAKPGGDWGLGNGLWSAHATVRGLCTLSAHGETPEECEAGLVASAQRVADGCALMLSQAPSAGLAARLLDGATPERLAWLADVGEALTVTSGQRVGKKAVKR
jgi:hypothetical protein